MNRVRIEKESKLPTYQADFLHNASHVADLGDDPADLLAESQLESAHWRRWGWLLSRRLSAWKVGRLFIALVVVVLAVLSELWPDRAGADNLCRRLLSCLAFLQIRQLLYKLCSIYRERQSYHSTVESVLEGVVLKRIDQGEVIVFFGCPGNGAIIRCGPIIRYGAIIRNHWALVSCGVPPSL